MGIVREFKKVGVGDIVLITVGAHEGKYGVVTERYPRTGNPHDDCLAKKVRVRLADQFQSSKGRVFTTRSIEVIDRAYDNNFNRVNLPHPSKYPLEE